MLALIIICALVWFLNWIITPVSYPRDVFYTSSDGYYAWVEIHRNNITASIGVVISNTESTITELVKIGKKYKRNGETPMQGLSFMYHYAPSFHNIHNYIFIPKLQLKYHNSIMAQCTISNTTSAKIKTYDNMNSFEIKIPNHDGVEMLYNFYRIIDK